MDQHCNIWDKLGMRDVIRSKDWHYPLFRLDRVVERLQIHGGEEEGLFLNGTEVSTQLLLWLQPVNSSDLQFASFSAEVVDAIGLSNSFSPNSLPIPLACSIRTILGAFFVLLWRSGICSQTWLALHHQLYTVINPGPRSMLHRSLIHEEKTPIGQNTRSIGASVGGCIRSPRPMRQ